VGAEHGVAFDFPDTGGFFRLVILDPANARWERAVSEMVPAYPHDGTRTMHLRLSFEKAQGRFIWCILLDPAPGTARWEEDGDQLSIRFEGGLTLFQRDGFLKRAKLT
jgi:hypothetical protein